MGKRGEMLNLRSLLCCFILAVPILDLARIQSNPMRSGRVFRCAVLGMPEVEENTTSIQMNWKQRFLRTDRDLFRYVVQKLVCINVWRCYKPSNVLPE